MTTSPAFCVLRGDGVSVVFQFLVPGLPVVLHWGADLGQLSGDDLRGLSSAVSRQAAGRTLDSAWQLSTLPQESDGWPGRPALLASRAGTPLFPRWKLLDIDVAPRTLTIRAADVGTVRNGVDVGLLLESRWEIAVGGVVTVQHALTNTAVGAVAVDWLEATLPTPKSVDHTTEFAGRWTREKVPHTFPALRGSHVRQTRRGRSGHDATNLLIASIGAPADRTGELWAVHLGWSADTTYRTDRGPDSVPLIGAGELLRPNEIVLERDATYRTPVAYFAASDTGLDGLSDRFHRYLRGRPQHPRSPRPLVLNTWEAVYFDHDPAFLLQLAETAARVGVERFVLDDGWFLARRTDNAGLGDWVVDPAVWPDGLGPLADRVHQLGMEFGLWFEPEMVNLDSNLARAHPDWLLHNPDHVSGPTGLSWRSQYVLDIANEHAYASVFGQITALVDELGIDFIKWDHNRDLIESVHDGRPGVHAQTTALYRLIGELKARHPGLEIESCSSGGARSDLGVLEVTDRVWASDSNDPIERQDIQRWTQLLLPPELVGGHVGPTTAHSSGRTTALSYRLATSLMGSAGFEWNIAECADDELETITRWSALYKELRHVIHNGTAIHGDVHDPALRLVGAVAADRSEAVFTIATVATLEDAVPERIRLHGLDPTRRYQLRVRDEIGAAEHGPETPEWLAAGEITVTGSVLGAVGLQIPPLWPAQAIVLHVVAEPNGGTDD